MVHMDLQHELFLPTTPRKCKLIPSLRVSESVAKYGAKERDDKFVPVPIETHVENLALFYPWFSTRDGGTSSVGWGKVFYRTLEAFLVMEYVIRGDANFGVRSAGFREAWKSRVSDRKYVEKYVFGTNRSGDVWLDVWPSGEKRGRKASRKRRLPPFPTWANGGAGTKLERQSFRKRWGGLGEAEVLKMGWLNKDYRRGAPGQHWLGGEMPDLWDRVPAGIPKHYRKTKRVVNLGMPAYLVKRRKSQRNRRWFGFWLPRTEWQLPELAGFDELRQLPLRTRSTRGKRVLDKGDREVFLKLLGLGRELDWQRWVYNGWHVFDGATEAVRSAGDLEARERWGTHPHSEAWGGVGSPFVDPRGKVGEAGSAIDWVEMEAPWLHVRFTREYKRELVLKFNESKKEWLDMAQGNDKLSKPVRKRIEPFIEEARQMTEREKHMHIMGLGDGVGAFCKFVGELRYTNEQAYEAAFPDKSSNPNTVKGCASRLMKEDRVALGVAIYVVSRTETVKEAAQVKFMDLYTRTMEVFQASMDTSNHKVALDAIKFLAEVSGHLDKGKGGAKASGPSGVNVNILQSNGSTPSQVGSATSLTFDNPPLVTDQSARGELLAIPDTREQRAKARLRQFIDVMDTKVNDMEWVNTNSLVLDEDDDVEEPS